MKLAIVATFLIFGAYTAHAELAAPRSNDRAEFDGRYEVPVPADQPELTPFSSFPLDEISLRVRGSEARIKYDLPIELTGVINSIVLTSTADETGAFRKWEGPLGTAVCKDNQCDVAYQDLTIDMNAIQARLVGQGLPMAEIDLRLRVAGHFRDDPHGRVIGGRRLDYTQARK
jgi:hypothetical protein